MKLSPTTSGLLDPAKLTAWTSAKQAAIRKAVGDGLQAGGKEVVNEVRARMRSDFAVRKTAFVNSLRAKRYDRDPAKLPALLIGSKIPWLGLHVRGGAITGRMLIPLLPEFQRIGPKAFRRVVDGLLRTGNAFFIQKNGKAILMAENIRENQSELRRFKRAERSRTGAKRLSRGQEIPIAVLVSSVTLKRRFDLVGAVRARLPDLARAIETRLKDY